MFEQRQWQITQIIVSVLLALFASGGNLRAQSPLEPLVQRALLNNPGLKAQRSRVEAARQVPSQMKALPDPTADIEFMNIALNGSSGSETFTRGVSAGVTQMLPFPGKRGLAAKAAEREVAVESARLATMEQAVRSEVLSAAFRYKMVSELLRINDQTDEALKMTVESALARYAAGAGSQSDVLFAQSEVTKVATRRRDLESQLAIAKAREESLVAESVDEATLEKVELPPPSALPGLEPLLSFVSEHAPEVAMAQAEIEVAEARAEVAKKAFKPDFMVGGRYRYKDMTMGGQDYLTAMVGITLPFFHYKDRYRRGLDEALYRKQSAQDEARQARNTARYKLAEAYQSADRDAKVFALYDQGLLLQARQAYEATLSAYQTSRTDFSALLMSVTNLYMLEADAIMATAEYHQRVAEMEAVLGRPLSKAALGSTVTP